MLFSIFLSKDFLGYLLYFSMILWGVFIKEKNGNFRKVKRHELLSLDKDQRSVKEY